MKLHLLELGANYGTHLHTLPWPPPKHRPEVMCGMWSHWGVYWNGNQHDKNTWCFTYRHINKKHDCTDEHKHPGASWHQINVIKSEHTHLKFCTDRRFSSCRWEKISCLLFWNPLLWINIGVALLNRLNKIKQAPISTSPPWLCNKASRRGWISERQKTDMSHRFL